MLARSDSSVAPPPPPARTTSIAYSPPLSPSSSASHSRRTGHTRRQSESHVSASGSPPSSTLRRRQKPEASTAHTRSRSQTDLLHRPGFLFTPSETPVVVPATPPLFSPKKSASSPHLSHARSRSNSGSAAFEPVYPSWQLSSMDGKSDDEGDGDEIIFVSRSISSSADLRARRPVVGRRSSDVPRAVTTSRGQAGDTETDVDEGAGGLPTARNAPDSRPLLLWAMEQLIPYLFEILRLLSIVPSIFGTLYNIHNAYHPPSTNTFNTSIDYSISALWAILTGIQCLAMTTGLLSRWRAYYATFSTLIRLLALQAICWPATHLTLTLFNHAKRPIACWMIIGTTTCFSRSVQMWVTSNLWDGRIVRGEGRFGSRKWDWVEVGVKCVLPASVLYFITAWALVLQNEFTGY